MLRPNAALIKDDALCSVQKKKKKNKVHKNKRTGLLTLLSILHIVIMQPSAFVQEMREQSFRKIIKFLAAKKQCRYKFSREKRFICEFNAAYTFLIQFRKKKEYTPDYNSSLQYITAVDTHLACFSLPPYWNLNPFHSRSIAQ